MAEETQRPAHSPSDTPPPDIEIGGRAYVRVRDGRSDRPLLLPADAELSAEEADRHYRRSSQVMARQIERGKAPWQRARDPGFALPENVERRSSRPFRGQNAVWLQAAADHRGYGDRRWGTAASVEQAGGRVRPAERSNGITVLLWRQHWRTYAPRTFAVTVYNAEQCEGLEPADRRPPATWSERQPSARQLLQAADPEHSPGARAHYDADRDRIVLPPESAFADERAYLRAGIRQLGPWTGHPTRLASPDHGFPRHVSASAREGLRGEIHAMLAGCRLGLGHEPARDARLEALQAAALRQDPHEIYRAGTAAEEMLAWTAERSRPLPPEPPKPAHGLTPMADLARNLLENPPWERSR